VVPPWNIQEPIGWPDSQRLNEGTGDLGADQPLAIPFQFLIGYSAVRHLDLSGGVGRWAFVISAGIFATTLPQSQSLPLPLRNLLNNDLHANVA
jgi:hypothetical protein